jgi:hypothetical protein
VTEPTDEEPVSESLNDIMRRVGGRTIGNMTHEEAKPIIAEIMRKHLRIPEGQDFEFTEMDFKFAINAMPMEEYAEKRAAIAAFRLGGP